MQTTNHFQSVKKFINARVGSTFTTKEFHDAMLGIESNTRWKFHNNKFYRSNTYRTYLKRLGYLKNPKRGEWQVVKSIPSWLNLGHVNFILFTTYAYKSGLNIVDSYWGVTRQQLRTIQQHPSNQLITNRKDFDLFVKIIS
jgi:hypothetical protein